MSIKRLSVDIPETLHIRAKMVALCQGTTLSAMVLTLLKAHVEESDCVLESLGKPSNGNGNSNGNGKSKVLVANSSPCD